MLTVAIYINDSPIVAINAVNMGEKNVEGETKYKTTEGNVIWHKPSAGPVALAKKLLDCIRIE